MLELPEFDVAPPEVDAGDEEGDDVDCELDRCWEVATGSMLFHSASERDMSMVLTNRHWLTMGS